MMTDGMSSERAQEDDQRRHHLLQNRRTTQDKKHRSHFEVSLCTHQMPAVVVSIIKAMLPHVGKERKGKVRKGKERREAG